MLSFWLPGRGYARSLVRAGPQRRGRRVHVGAVPRLEASVADQRAGGGRPGGRFLRRRLAVQREREGGVGAAGRRRRLGGRRVPVAVLRAARDARVRPRAQVRRDDLQPRGPGGRLPVGLRRGPLRRLREPLGLQEAPEDDGRVGRRSVRRAVLRHAPAALAPGPPRRLALPGDAAALRERLRGVRRLRAALGRRRDLQGRHGPRPPRGTRFLSPNFKNAIHIEVVSADSLDEWSSSARPSRGVAGSPWSSILATSNVAWVPRRSATRTTVGSATSSSSAARGPRPLGRFFIISKKGVQVSAARAGGCRP